MDPTDRDPQHSLVKIKLISHHSLTAFPELLVRIRTENQNNVAPRRLQTKGASVTSGLVYRVSTLQSSVVDPHWFHGGSESGSSFLSQCGSRPDHDPESQTNADQCGSRPDPGQTFKSQKVEYLHEKYTY
jgi:hypothetical protein